MNQSKTISDGAYTPSVVNLVRSGKHLCDTNQQVHVMPKKSCIIVFRSLHTYNDHADSGGCAVQYKVS